MTLERRVLGLERRLEALQNDLLQYVAGTAVTLDVIARLLEANEALTRHDLIAELRTMEAQADEKWNGPGYGVAAVLLNALERRRPRPTTRRRS